MLLDINTIVVLNILLWISIFLITYYALSRTLFAAFLLTLIIMCIIAPTFVPTTPISSATYNNYIMLLYVFCFLIIIFFVIYVLASSNSNRFYYNNIKNGSSKSAA
jgi:hypothetical protein